MGRAESPPIRRLTRAMVRDLELLLLPGAADLGASRALARECTAAVQRVAEADQSRVDLELFVRIRTWLRPDGSDVAYEVIDAWLCQARALVAGDDPPQVRPHACRHVPSGCDQMCGSPALPGSRYCPLHRLPALRRAIDVA
jgi:hypothetical protein